MSIEQDVLETLSSHAKPTYVIANLSGHRGETARVRLVLYRLCDQGKAERISYRFSPWFAWKKPANG